MLCTFATKKRSLLFQMHLNETKWFVLCRGAKRDSGILARLENIGQLFCPKKYCKELFKVLTSLNFLAA
jgi:hypothetical protein